MERRIEAFEIWLYRRMLNISWVDYVSNEQALQRAGAEREIMASLRLRQLRAYALWGKSKAGEGEDAQGSNLWID